MDDGITPFALINKDYGAILQYSMSFLYGMNNYDEFLKDSMTGTIDVQKYDTQLQKVADHIIELNSYAQADSMAAEGSQAIADFANGDAAMTINGSWAIPSIKAANPDLNFEMFTFPGETADKTVAGVFTGDYALAISANTKNADACKKFLAFMSQTDVAQRYAEQDGSMSCIIGVDYVAPELEKQYEVISAGKIKMYPDAFWNGTVNGLVGQSIQELIISHDKEAWIDELLDVFKNEYAE
jgi:raffinose/stachyose/melibiose transport system substrate-binding protein